MEKWRQDKCFRIRNQGTIFLKALQNHFSHLPEIFLILLEHFFLPSTEDFCEKKMKGMNNGITKSLKNMTAEVVVQPLELW